MVWKKGHYKYRSDKEEQIKKGILLLISYILIFSVGYMYAYQTIPRSPEPQVLTPMPVSGNFTASTNILAVNSINGSGVMGSVIVEIHPGKGRVLMNTNPFIEPDTQYSAENAVSAAQNYTKKL